MSGPGSTRLYGGIRIYLGQAPGPLACLEVDDAGIKISPFFPWPDGAKKRVDWRAIVSVQEAMAYVQMPRHGVVFVRRDVPEWRNWIVFWCGARKVPDVLEVAATKGVDVVLGRRRFVC
jgi:hypothetical protein